MSFITDVKKLLGINTSQAKPEKQAFTTPKTYCEAVATAKRMGYTTTSDGKYSPEFLSGLFGVSTYAYMTPKQVQQAKAAERVERAEMARRR